MIKEVTTAALIGASAPFLVGALGISPPPDGLWWAPYVMTGVFGLAAAALQLAGHLYSARKRAKAEFDEEESARLLANTDATDDDKARELRLEAKTLRAEAEAIDTTANRAAEQIGRKGLPNG